MSAFFDRLIENCKWAVPQFQIWSSNIKNSVYKCSKQEIEWDHQKQPFQVQKGLSVTQKSKVTKKFHKITWFHYFNAHNFCICTFFLKSKLKNRLTRFWT